MMKDGNYLIFVLVLTSGFEAYSQFTLCSNPRIVLHF